MPRSSFMLSPLHRARTAVTASLCLAALAVPMVASQGTAAAATALPVSDEYRPAASIGFHDWTRDGSARAIRDDLTGDLGAMVEFAQMSTVDATGNADNDMPMLVADRVALLMVTPTTPVSSLSADVFVKGEKKGTLQLAHPNLLPASDQNYDNRGSIAYSLRAWSAEIPGEWIMPGMTLTITDGAGTQGTVDEIEMSAPKEMVINNIRLGMLTDAPVAHVHRFINDPVDAATDYFQTIPIAKLTMAQYETVKLDKVIVGTGDIYTVSNPDPSIGSVYAGTMRENVGKAQVSTGINLATWGITSSQMNQRQPGNTNQRVIHHSAGLYMQNGKGESGGPFVAVHGLSGGNGMATLTSSTGNELSHELGHSYGLGHYPGMDTTKTGDDIMRVAVHHMDSGWGYIPYRGVMRSNLSTNAYDENRVIYGHAFGENLKGLYNFNTDTMSGGWDASPISEYTHMTGHSLRITQNNLKNLVADTDYPSGYRNWDPVEGWVDAKVLDPEFDLLRPAKVGVPTFSILGGYNPADTKQTLIYDAFRSNYGVTFDLPQVDTSVVSDERVCWLEVTFDGGATKNIEIDATDGVKQVNVNIAEADRPTGAQIACRVDGKTTKLGNKITIATDLEPMTAAVVVGGEAGFETLRAEELAELQPTLEALSGDNAPVLSANDMIVLRGWADDLSKLSSKARTVAERILQLEQDAADVEAYVLEHGGTDVNASDLPELVSFLKERGYVGEDGSILPKAQTVTVDKTACLYVDEAAALRIDSDKDCADNRTETWFVDVANRIHSGSEPGQCITFRSPIGMADCTLNDINQRWIFRDDSTVGRASNPGSMMDYNRNTKYVTHYPHYATGNQVWTTFEKDSNPLFAYMSAAGMEAFVGDGVAHDDTAEGGNGDGENTEEPVEGGIEDAFPEPTDPVVDPTEPVDPAVPGEDDQPVDEQPVEDEEPAEGGLEEAFPEPNQPGEPAAPADEEPVDDPTHEDHNHDGDDHDHAGEAGEGAQGGDTATGGLGTGVGAAPNELALTGSATPWIALGSALVLLLAGASVLLARRSRRA
ncbi:M66 family metalloprotease [Microbacterium sp. GXF6406]